MKGLLIKEVYSMRTVIKQFGIVFILMGVWCCFMKNPAFFPMITTMYGSMLILTSMSYDETVHFDKYEMTLPVPRRQVVVSKYLMLAILVVIGAGVGIVGDTVMRAVMTEMNGTILEDMVSAIAVAGVYLLAFSILIPIAFKLGVEKSRLYLVVIYFAVFGILYGASSMMKEQMTGIFVIMEDYPLAVMAAILVLTVLILSVSCLVSIRIIQKKEW